MCSLMLNIISNHLFNMNTLNNQFWMNHCGWIQQTGIGQFVRHYSFSLYVHMSACACISKNTVLSLFAKIYLEPVWNKNKTKIRLWNKFFSLYVILQKENASDIINIMFFFHIFILYNRYQFQKHSDL